MTDKKCPICNGALQNGGDIYLCGECNRYYSQLILDMPNKVAPSFFDLPERDQIIIAKEQMKGKGK